MLTLGRKMMKKLIVTHALVFAVGIAIGYAVTRYWIVSPEAVMMAVGNSLWDFGISETNCPTEQIISLVNQAVENPRRKTWTVYHRTWTEPAGPMYFPETNKTIGPFYAITETNETTQPESGHVRK